jgi:hypothetical protein
MTYNGWSNYETWAVNIWCGDDITEDPERLLQLYKAGDPGHLLREWVLTEWLPEVVGLPSDLLHYAIDNVDWDALAEAYLDDYEPDGEEEDG